MRIVAIGSRVFITSFQLAGVQGLKVDTPSDALSEINKLTGKNDVGLVLLSDDIAKDIRRELTDVRAKTPVNQLLQARKQMEKVMKQLSKGKIPTFPVPTGRR